MFTAAHLLELGIEQGVIDDARTLGISLKDLMQLLIKYGVEAVKQILADLFKVLPSAK
jgi:hypothetical protein